MSQRSFKSLVRALPATLVVASLTFSGAVPCAAAEEPETSPYRFGIELKANWRDSKQVSIPNPFPFDAVPPLRRINFEPVNAGSHAEISAVTLRFEANWSELLAARIKLDFIDRYDRNPTSAGDEFDVDEAWFRWGREIDGGGAPSENRAVYAKIGKFGKFERQDDRHLESYGMVSTAFNRLEDIGLELGIDFTRNLYAKASYSQGNPLFFRDVNALAGDNGTEIFHVGTPPFVPNAVTELKSGFPIFYDADVDFEDVDFEEPELGLGIGWRWGGDRVVGDVMVWGYKRDLADTVDFDGTFYGGDFDLLDGPDLGPLGTFPLPGLIGRDKRELGANFWLYAGGLSVFGQYADQDLAGLGREGFEVEVAWSFELPLFAAIGGRQLFPWIAPAVRYSDISSDFVINPLRPYPASSTTWDWTKLDLGLRLGLWENMDLTVEWADVEFETPAGMRRNPDEFLLTLRLGFDHEWGN